MYLQNILLKITQIFVHNKIIIVLIFHPGPIPIDCRRTMTHE